MDTIIKIHKPEELIVNRYYWCILKGHNYAEIFPVGQRGSWLHIDDRGANSPDDTAFSVWDIYGPLPSLQDILGLMEQLKDFTNQLRIAEERNRILMEALSWISGAAYFGSCSTRITDLSKEAKQAIEQCNEVK